VSSSKAKNPLSEAAINAYEAAYNI